MVRLKRLFTYYAYQRFDFGMLHANLAPADQRTEQREKERESKRSVRALFGIIKGANVFWGNVLPVAGINLGRFGRSRGEG